MTSKTNLAIDSSMDYVFDHDGDTIWQTGPVHYGIRRKGVIDSPTWWGHTVEEVIGLVQGSRTRKQCHRDFILIQGVLGWAIGAAHPSTWNQPHTLHFFTRSVIIPWREVDNH